MIIVMKKGASKNELAEVKQRIKDPHRRPQLGERGRDARKWKARRHHPDLTDEQARGLRVGGEVLCEIW